MLLDCELRHRNGSEVRRVPEKHLAISGSRFHQRAGLHS